MQNSTIEWTDHTHNWWHGCVKVSPGCEHCYAMTLSKRFGRDIWGPAKTTSRMMMSENYWRQPLKWNAAAEKAGTQARVFCSSMADVFEDHPDVAEARARGFALIEQTPWLDWQLLTKRPENIRRMVPPTWLTQPRENVWYGTSVESQVYAEKRIPELLKIPAWVRFLSCEPLLSEVDLSPWLFDVESGDPTPVLDWVIVGGESGAGARPMHPDWSRDLRDVCYAAGVHFFFKQWGEYKPISEMSDDEHESLYIQPSEDDSMASPRCRVQTTSVQWHDGKPGYTKLSDGKPGYMCFRLGKHAAGRLLDGREWNDLPL